MMFVPHRKHASGLPRLVTTIALLHFLPLHVFTLSANVIGYSAQRLGFEVDNRRVGVRFPPGAEVFPFSTASRPILKLQDTYSIRSLCLSSVKRPKSRSKVKNARFEVFTEVTMKNAAFWDVTPCGSCKNPRFRGT
jgi:hypothetical protein